VTRPEPRRFIILLGPTGVGKTEIGFSLAKHLSGEIVSADSRLVYRLMDIGTAKPDRRMLAEIPHHLVDIVYPDDIYTCKRFEHDARKAIREILDRGRIPIVVGGSGLYLRALTDGIFEGPGRDPVLRERLWREIESEGKQLLWRRLKEVDPDKAKAIDPENAVRIVRALEVYHSSGSPMSELERLREPIGIPCAKIGLTRTRAEIHRIIDDRVERMMELGLLDEARKLIDGGYAASPAVCGSLGYREMIRHIEGSLTLAEAVESVRRNTRHFAKRQITWFRADKDITWKDITGRTDFGLIAQEIAAQLL
jgi:tRNA dimethylallyltransferase